MQIGTPPQALRLLPSTSGNSLWPVLEGGCPTGQSPGNCPDLRATFFSPNSSSTWSEIGLYGLILTEESTLGYGANASYGFDQVVLSRPGDPGMPTLQHQVIAGFIDDSIYVGSLGLYPLAVNISNLTDPHLSLMGSLRNESKIPSTSWSYTAGAHYREPAAFGSLTLGGYDAERFVPNNLTFPFGADISRDLVAGLQKIDTNVEAGADLLGGGIYVFFDSLVPEIWLPVQSCQAFEKVFGLEYNKTMEMYFVNDTLHSHLTSLNPNISFTFGQESSAGSTIEITMQYGSFDLQYEDPSTGNTNRYFPLKQASNASMYTMGRVFFQDAYLIADYDRHNFSISQAVFPNSTNAQRIVPIRPPGDLASTRGKLSPGDIAGIVIGAIVGFALAAAMIYLWLRRRLQMKNPNHQSDRMDDEFRKPELDAAGPGKHEMSDEAEVQTWTPELSDVKKTRAELAVAGNDHAELTGFNKSLPELVDTHQPGAELPAAKDVKFHQELPADNIPVTHCELPAPIAELRSPSSPISGSPSTSSPRTSAQRRWSFLHRERSNG